MFNEKSLNFDEITNIISKFKFKMLLKQNCPNIFM